jgi:hypothetical protein
MGLAIGKSRHATIQGSRSRFDRCLTGAVAESARSGFRAAAGRFLEPAYKQAKSYAEVLPLPNCKRIMTTDGCRLFLYKRPGDSWPDELEPIGYVNLSSIRRENVFPFGTSGVKTLIDLIPWNVIQTNG